MSHPGENPDASCRGDAELAAGYRQRIPDVAEAIIANCAEPEVFTHIDTEPIPSEGNVLEIIRQLKALCFPGFFAREKIDPYNLAYTMGRTVSDLFDLLSEQITHSIRHDCFRFNQPCTECARRGQQSALALLESVPDIRRILATDVRAAFEGDPAAKSFDEIIFSYPGIFAVMVHRTAHRLHRLGVPLLPRIMSEHAHSVTGIDIHPGAEIGPRFVIDHGTGVVIGETSRIGENVRIYQGVTLGALSLSKDAVAKLRGQKRHPTIEEDVIIYSGATILGGETVIGARSVIGGNVWITSSVPPDTRVVMDSPRLVYR